MLATYEDVVRYLLQHGWIGAETIVEGDVAVLNASRRNGNFTVLNGAGPHYFLKQEIRDRRADGLAFGSIAYEAAVYECLGDTAISGCLPRVYAFDQAEQLLVLEALADWTNLRDHHRRRRRVSAAIAGSLGRALADLHTSSARAPAPVEPAAPWIFFLPEPDQWIYENSSVAAFELLGVLQESEDLCRAFVDLRQRWNSDCLVHGDLKWENCLVPAGARSRPAPPVKFVDWELARPGDPRWDVGTVMSGYLDAWLSSVPISGEDPPDRFLPFARFPLERMQSSLRAFWTAYRRCRRIPSADVREWLEGATAFAGIRLVQTAFEQSQVDDRLSARAVSLMQLSANLLDRPLEAAVQLLGLPLPDPSRATLALR